MSARRNLSTAHRGLTMIEVVLVLALLVVLASLTWPLMARAFEGQKLRAAGDLVRARLVRSRVEAINNVATIQFRYEIDGRRFKISKPSANSTTDARAEASSDAENADGASAAPEWQNGELPEGITFAASPQPQDPSMAFGTSSADDANWSPPIYFQPDGSASSTVVRIHNERGRSVDLTVRGLTGVVAVSDVFTDTGGL